MLIDWFTTVAQLVNFLVLIWAMKRFLYQPILDTLDKREKLIASRLEEANEIKQSSVQAKNEYDQKNTEFDANRVRMNTQAENEIHEEKLRLLQLTRAEVEKLRKQYLEALSTEQNRMGAEIIADVTENMLHIAGNLLKDLAGEDIEDRMIDKFLAKVGEMPQSEKQTFLHLKMDQLQPVCTVKTRWIQKQSNQEKIIQSLKKTLSNDLQVRFESDQTLSPGISLISRGHKIEWSVDEYMRQFKIQLPTNKGKSSER